MQTLAIENWYYNFEGKDIDRKKWIRWLHDSRYVDDFWLIEIEPNNNWCS